MTKRAIWVASLAIGLLAGGAVQAQEQAPWLHIRVTEEGENGSKVNVNLPLSLVQVALDIAEAEIMREGHAHFRHSDVTVADLRRMWDELRAAGDAEFISVEEDDQSITVSRRGDKVLVEIEDLEEGTEKGRIEVPVSVVDALLEGEGETLNLRAALDELVRAQQGEIVMIDNDDTYVRIWIE